MKCWKDYLIPTLKGAEGSTGVVNALPRKGGKLTCHINECKNM